MLICEILPLMTFMKTTTNFLEGLMADLAECLKRVASPMLALSKQLKRGRMFQSFRQNLHACGKSELTKASQLWHHEEHHKSEDKEASKYCQIPKPAGLN